jgi:hypothetical protein
VPKARESPGHGREQGRSHRARPGRRARGMGWGVAGYGGGSRRGGARGGDGLTGAKEGARGEVLAGGRACGQGGRAAGEGARATGRGARRARGGRAGRPPGRGRDGGLAGGAGSAGAGLAGGGARGPDRAGLGHTVDPNPRHARPLNGIRSQTEIRNRTRRTRD